MPNYMNGFNNQQMGAMNYPQQTQIAQPPTPTNILTVPVESGADVNYIPVAAGCQVLFISFNEKKFWIKTTARNGIQEPIRTFTFDEVITPVLQNQNEGNYVSKDEFNALSSKLDKLLSELGGEK